MAGSGFGTNFRITTWGETHGAGVGVVVDGCPAGLPLEREDVQKYLDRRKPGQSNPWAPVPPWCCWPAGCSCGARRMPI